MNIKQKINEIDNILVRLSSKEFFDALVYLGITESVLHELAMDKIKYELSDKEIEEFYNYLIK